MDTELGDLLELFQQAENQAEFVESTLRVVSSAKDPEQKHVGIVVDRLANDMRVMKKLIREIKRAAIATPNHCPLAVVKAAS